MLLAVGVKENADDALLATVRRHGRETKLELAKFCGEGQTEGYRKLSALLVLHRSVEN